MKNIIIKLLILRKSINNKNNFIYILLHMVDDYLIHLKEALTLSCIENKYI